MSVNDPMMESKHHDPMLDGITRYGDPTHDYMLPAHGEGFVVLFSDLPALLAAAREDERQRVTSDFAEYLRHMEEWQAGYNKGHAAGVEQGQRDEREACIAAIEAQKVKWSIDYDTALDDALAAIRARGEKS